MPLVTIEPDGEHVPVSPGETILEGLYNSGYAYRIGCRRGGCAICKVDLISGQVSYNRTVCDTVLSDDERASGTALTCRAVPEGDVTIRLRDQSIRLTNAMLRKIRLAAYDKAQRATTDPNPPADQAAE